MIRSALHSPACSYRDQTATYVTKFVAGAKNTDDLDDLYDMYDEEDNEVMSEESPDKKTNGSGSKKEPD